MFKLVPREAWQIAPSVGIRRRSLLLGHTPFEAVLDLLDKQLSLVRLSQEQMKKDNRYHRSVITFRAKSQTIDLWHNSRGGYGTSGDHFLWSEHQKKRFFLHYDFGGQQQALADIHFAEMMRGVAKYLDDCGLFIFGYLVRAFWKQVLNAGQKKIEDEIWVSGIFGVSINMFVPVSEK